MPPPTRHVRSVGTVPQARPPKTLKSSASLQQEYPRLILRARAMCQCSLHRRLLHREFGRAVHENSRCPDGRDSDSALWRASHWLGTTTVRGTRRSTFWAIDESGQASLRKVLWTPVEPELTHFHDVISIEFHLKPEGAPRQA